jgi:hypothetical protein
MHKHASTHRSDLAIDNRTFSRSSTVAAVTVALVFAPAFLAAPAAFGAEPTVSDPSVVEPSDPAAEGTVTNEFGNLVFFDETGTTGNTEGATSSNIVGENPQIRVDGVNLRHDQAYTTGVYGPDGCCQHWSKAHATA